MTLAVSLARQSRNRDADHDDSVSIAFQHKVNREEAARRDDEIAVEFEDVDVSGHGDSKRKREGLHAMLAYLKAHPNIRRVYIYNVSRLARDTHFLLELVREMRALRPPVELRSSSENIEDPTILTVIGAFAERERTQLSNNVAYAVREQASRGLVTQQVPFGYSRTDGVLYPDEPNASVVRRIFRDFAAGHSTFQIIESLRDEGIRSPEGKPAWRGKTIRGLLARRTYIGEIEISETRDPAGRIRPHLIAKGRHDPLIDEETWTLVQSILADARWTRTKTEPNPWLAKAMVCSECGRVIYVGIKSKRSAGLRWYAKCSTAQLASDARIATTCPGQKSADLHLIEPVARLALYNRLCGIVTAQDAYESQRVLTARRGGDRRAELALRIKADKDESAELLDIRLKRLIGDDEFIERRLKLEASIESMQQELDQIPVEVPLSAFVAARSRIEDAASRVLDGDDATLRSLVTILGATATINLKTKSATWNFGDDYTALLPVTI